MAARKSQISKGQIKTDPVVIAIDRCFADLVSNVPLLRQTEHHNEVIKARESLKAVLIATQNTTHKTEA